MLGLVGILAVLLASAAGGAEPVRQASIALVIGSNRGGPGQQELRYAEDDARRVAEVLGTLGGYPPEHVQVLLRPGRAEVLAALDAVRARVRALQRDGKQAQVFFYYSGHARAAAIHLGGEEVGLGELRQRLLDVPAHLTLAVLDACQSGAFSRVKGAEPAQDFSYNTVQRLQAQGVAVLASSTGSELSQESDELRSSYFTHHLLVALRGAADSDADGRVTLGEAYRYAYHRTLVDTSTTQVGSQHVTLETGLRGKGEVVLSYPAEASAQLELGAALEGQVLIERQPGGSVLAEVHKAAGTPLRLALPPGPYAALVRRGGQARRCTLALAEQRVVPLQEDACVAVAMPATAKKHADEALSETWALELGIAGLKGVEDSYTSRLGDFGWGERLSFGGRSAKLSATAIRWLSRHIGFLAEIETFDARDYARNSRTGPEAQTEQRFSWSTLGFGIHMRVATRPLLAGWLVPYAQAGAGLGFGRTIYGELDGGESTQLHLGYHASLAAGTTVMPWHRFGFFVQLGLVKAPIVDNLLGETHDSGGSYLRLGIRGTL